MKETTCCFSGHRKLPPEKRAEILENLERRVEMLIKDGFRRFMAGGALGFDTAAALTVLKLKEKFPQIELSLALPCPSQASRWGESDQAVYEEIKKQADSVHYTSEKYGRGCMQIRNRYMVDHSSACICYLTENNGGTYYTVKYAASKNIAIHNLAECDICP